MLKGSCLCAGISYEIDGPLEDMRNCRCSICRTAHSVAFRSSVSVRSRDFHRTAGENLVTWYESSPGTQRGLCSRSGSPPLSRFHANPDVYGLPLGCLDADPGVRPAMHIFVGSKAPRFDITDSLPRYEEGPPR